MSQERPEDAKAAAVQGWELWRELGAGQSHPPLHLATLAYLTLQRPESEHYPPAQARLNLAKLLLELSMHAEALEILQRLENEDDEDSEVWYLSGWAWWLLGESRPEGAPSTDEEESREECWSEGKLCLENYMRVSCSPPFNPLLQKLICTSRLQLDGLEPENSDPEQLAHVNELLEKLEKLGVVASAGREEEGEGPWEDEESDDEEENAMEE
jgi:tetratricopeptide (TPR) repeat protein